MTDGADQVLGRRRRAPSRPRRSSRGSPPSSSAARSALRSHTAGTRVVERGGRHRREQRFEARAQLDRQRALDRFVVRALHVLVDERGHGFAQRGRAEQAHDRRQQARRIARRQAREREVLGPRELDGAREHRADLVERRRRRFASASRRPSTITGVAAATTVTSACVSAKYSITAPVPSAVVRRGNMPTAGALLVAGMRLAPPQPARDERLVEIGPHQRGGLGERRRDRRERMLLADEQRRDPRRRPCTARRRASGTACGSAGTRSGGRRRCGRTRPRARASRGRRRPCSGGASRRPRRRDRRARRSQCVIAARWPATASRRDGSSLCFASSTSARRASVAPSESGASCDRALERRNAPGGCRRVARARDRGGTTAARDAMPAPSRTDRPSR